MQTNFNDIETSYLQDVLFAMQGIEGRVLKIDNDQGIWSELPDNKISELLCAPTRRAAFFCCEGGLYVRRINALVTMFKKDTIGNCKKRFCAFVEKELSEYFQFIAEMESLLRDNKKTYHFENFSISFPLTIMKLRMACISKFRNLKFIYKLCDLIKSPKTQGGVLCSLIYDVFVVNKLNELCELSKRAYMETSEPFFEMMFDWLVEGKLRDPYSEFLVKESTFGSNSYLRKSHNVRIEMVPNFISRKTAQKVCEVGLTANYILTHKPHSVSPASSRNGDFKSEAEFWKALNITSKSSIAETVSKMELNLSSMFIKTLLADFSFASHFEAVKRFLLHAQGDFLEVLMGSPLREIMNKDEGKCCAATVNPEVQNCLLQMNCMKPDGGNFVLEFSKMNNPNCINGLDVFALICKLSPDNPLNIVFEKSSQHKYKTIFNFVWKIKFAIHELSHTLLKGLKLMKRSKSSKSKSFKFYNNGSKFFKGSEIHYDSLKKSMCLCSALRVFLQRFLNTAAYSGIEFETASFMSKCKKSTTLNKLLENHESFLRSIYDKLYLNKPQVYHLLVCVTKLAVGFARESLAHCKRVETLGGRESHEGVLKESLKNWKQSVSNCASTFAGYRKSLVSQSEDSEINFICD